MLDAVRAARKLDTRHRQARRDRRPLAGRPRRRCGRRRWRRSTRPTCKLRGTVAFAPASHLAEQSRRCCARSRPERPERPRRDDPARHRRRATRRSASPALLSDRGGGAVPADADRVPRRADRARARSAALAPAEPVPPGRRPRPARRRAGQLDDPEDLRIRTPVRIQQGDGRHDRVQALHRPAGRRVQASAATKVTYKTYEGVDHGGVVTNAKSAADATKYIRKRAAADWRATTPRRTLIAAGVRRFAVAAGPARGCSRASLDHARPARLPRDEGQAPRSRACSARCRSRWSRPPARAAASGARCRCWRCRPTTGWRSSAPGTATAKHPAWRHNLRANPDGEVEVERRPLGVPRRSRSRTSAASGSGSEALATYPGFAAYAKRAAPRRISVFVLHRA